MVRFIHTRVSIQPWVTHNPIDEVINNGGDIIYAAKPIVQGGVSEGCMASTSFWSLVALPLSPGWDSGPA